MYELAGHKNVTDQASYPLPTRVRRIAQRLNIWFEYLQKVGVLDNPNPIHAVIEPKRPKHRSSEFTNKEMDNLIQVVLTESRSHDRTRNWALVSIMLKADLFTLDLSHLREEHIGFLKGLSIRIEISGAEPVALPVEAAAALQQWLIERRKLLAELGNDSADVAIWLITSGRKRGQPLHQTSLRTIFRRYQRMARQHRAATNIQFPSVDKPLSVSGAQGLQRDFYAARRAFMHKLLEHSSTLWAGSEPSRAVLLQQEFGRYLYGHAVHQVPLRHLHDVTLSYERLAAQQQQLLRTLKLDGTGRKFQLPGWFDDIVHVDIEPVARIVSERFRRKNLLSHYLKVKGPDDEVLALITWLEGVKDDYLRVRKHFDNYYAHLHREQDSVPFRALIPDVGVYRDKRRRGCRGTRTT